MIEVLARLVSERGAPRFLRSDNGPEFVCQRVLNGSSRARIETALIDPGKPWQNGADESFNGKFRDECLSLDGSARGRSEGPDREWRRHYNEVRPHSSLDYLTPDEFRQHHESLNPEPLSNNGWRRSLGRSWVNTIPIDMAASATLNVKMPNLI